MAGINEAALIIGEAPEIEAMDDGAPLDIDAIEAIFEEMGEQGLSGEELDRLQREQAARTLADGEWYGNLVDKIPDGEQGALAQEIVRWVQFDEQSRYAWMERERRGIELLGVIDEKGKEEGRKDAREGLSRVTHPGLAEAGIQFYSRAIVEMWPPEGPVKAAVMGKPTEALKEQAGRVESFMNDLYTRRMPGGFSEESNMLMRLPFAGSTFKKVYYDAMENCVMSVFVEPSDFLVPYSATNLRNAPRYTHRMWESSYVVKRKMESGFYTNRTLTPATEARYPQTRRDIDHVDGKTENLVVEDRRHEILECHCYYDIKSLREAGKDGNPSDMPLPWVIVVDRDTQVILSARRNWKQSDDERKRIPCAVHYKFMPGFGFYGWGFFHWLGGLSESQTGAVRALLDSASYENFQGGFRSKDARVPGGALSPLPGEWIETEASPDELKNAFMPLPRHPPSETLFKLLGYMEETGRRVASTTEALVGDANTNGPVGTILALIEQGMKPAMAIHLGLHQAKADEFALVSDLLADFLPPRFEYAVPGESREIFATDFDDKVDIAPVSDPRIVTNTQRIAQNQSLMQLAQQFPNLYDAEEINRRMLEALRIPDIDRLLKPSKPVRMDAVQENMAMLTGKPVTALPEQLHQAHLQVHETWFDKLPQAFKQQIQGAFMAHMAEHLAWEYRNSLEMEMGTPLPFPMAMSHDRETGEKEGMTAEMDDTLSAMTARFIAGLSMQQEQARQMAEQAQIESQQRQDEEEQARKKAIEADEFERKQARLDAETLREIERQSAIAQAVREEKAKDNQAERIRQEEEQYQGLI